MPALKEIEQSLNHLFQIKNMEKIVPLVDLSHLYMILSTFRGNNFSKPIL